MTGVVKGLPQYNYPRPGSGNGYNYDRPGSGSQLSSGQKETGDKTPTPSDEDITNQIPSRELDNEEEEEQTDQKPIIHKHIYVHVAPPELEEEPETQKKLKAGRPEKHYKIIFIKAPTQSPASLSIPVPPAKEEKTIVYVLVKKPEEAQEVTIPTPEPTEPSKPEVYFIRYKASGKKEENNEDGNEEASAVPETESGVNGESPASPSYLPPSNRLRSAPDNNSQDYDSSY